MSKIVKREIVVSGITIQLTQKRIRNITIRVTMPDSQVKVSAPLYCNLAVINQFILQKLEWIKKNQNHIQSLREQGKLLIAPKFISGEEHYFFGQKLLFELIPNSAKNRVEITSNMMQLYVKNISNLKQRQKLVDDFYRREIKKIIPQLIAKYEEKMAIKLSDFGVKKMKTRWGTCNIKSRFIWLNLELAKRPQQFLESVIVHEMVHLFERKHNKNFYNLMDKFMPDWREIDRQFRNL